MHWGGIYGEPDFIEAFIFGFWGRMLRYENFSDTLNPKLESVFS